MSQKIQVALSSSAPITEMHSSVNIANRLQVNNFDLLRLVFASMVVFFHIAILSEQQQLSWLQNISATFAVQAFFFVSGFLVTMSRERTPSLPKYFSKRLLRIVPAYFFVVATAATLLASASTLTVSDYFTSPDWLRYLGYNLILSNFQAPSLPGVFTSNPEPAVNGSLWTIKIEVAFYLFVPIMVWLIRRLGHQKVLATVFFVSLGWRIGFDIADQLTNNDIYGKLAKQLPGQLCFFVGGAYAYYRTRDGKVPPPAWAAIIGLVAYAGSSNLAHQIISPFAVTVIVYWMAITVPNLGKAGKYGDFSYGIYLYHFPIVQYLVSTGHFAENPLASTITTVALVTILAIASWNFIEKPFLRNKTHALPQS